VIIEVLFGCRRTTTIQINASHGLLEHLKCSGMVSEQRVMANDMAAEMFKNPAFTFAPNF